MREVEFTIDATTGELTIHVKGIAGQACEDITRLAQELLGEPAHAWNTPEYYLRPQARPAIRPRRAR